MEEKGGQLSLDESIPLLRQIANGLDSAHTQATPLSHLGLKPKNILLTEDKLVKIADFGIANILSSPAARIPGREEPETLAYRAPEQITGSEIGPWTDIYSLAAIAYEILSGKPPIQGEDLRSQIINQPIKKIDDLPEHVNNALLLALSKNKSDRPQSAGDFIAMIGPNGGGKTTLLKLILGLVKPQKGNIIYHTEQGSIQDFIGYLPQVRKQDYHFPISVNEVVLSGLLSKERKRFNSYSKENKLLAHQLLERMGVLHLKGKAIGTLSGGQMQRVMLCRSLISSPRLLILDEPNTYVDNQFESDLYELLKELNSKMAILLVSHDLGTISFYIKTIACVNRNLPYHQSNIITEKQLEAYHCPIQIITHGDIPHTVLKTHKH